MNFIKVNEINEQEKSFSEKTFPDEFVDKLNDDLIEGQSVQEVPSGFDHLPECSNNNDHTDTGFVDKLSNTESINMILGLFPPEFLNHVRDLYEFNLSEDEIVESVKKASDFFHLKFPMDVREDMQTAVILGKTEKGNDDILLFNRAQMKELGITDREGFDLVMTHECGHRALQFLEGRYTDHQEELCCDFLAGVRAGLNGMDEEKLVLALEDTTESDSHPDGLLRAEAIKSGALFSKEYMAINNEAPTFEKCLERFDKKLDEMFGYIPNHEPNINLKADVLNDNETKAFFIDDKAYHLGKAQTAKEWAEYYKKRADEAIEKGDISAAKDYTQKAESYERQVKDHLQSASKCTK